MSCQRCRSVRRRQGLLPTVGDGEAVSCPPRRSDATPSHPCYNEPLRGPCWLLAPPDRRCRLLPPRALDLCSGDLCMPRKISIGAESFRRVRVNQFELVDKTRMIEQLCDDETMVLLLPRPRLPQTSQGCPTNSAVSARVQGILHGSPSVASDSQGSDRGAGRIVAAKSQILTATAVFCTRTGQEASVIRGCQSSSSVRYHAKRPRQPTSCMERLTKLILWCHRRPDWTWSVRTHQTLRLEGYVSGP